MNERKVNGEPLRHLAHSRMLIVVVAALLGMFAMVSTQLQAASTAPQNMLGVWQGFFQSITSDPTIPPVPRVPVSSEVTSQDNRRINGVMLVGGIIPCTLTFNGMVAASDRVNLQGQHEDHHGVAKFDLHDFGEGAAILDGSLTLVSAGGRVSDGSLLLLRPFAGPVPGDDVPNPAGSYRGAFRNSDGTSGEISAVIVGPPDDSTPTRFNGQVVVVAFGGRQVFELVGTINAAGRLIAIAQGQIGHFIFDAMWVGPPDDGMRATITGRHTLELNDGTVHAGTFSMTVE